MRTILKLALALLLPAALALPARAQEEGAGDPGGAPAEQAAAQDQSAGKTPDADVKKTAAPKNADAAKKAGARKKSSKKKPAKKKKKAEEPGSEYKFSSGGAQGTYKLDKDANPIREESAPKKKAAAKKKAAKKKAKKKAVKPEESGSDYKFSSGDSGSIYKLDRKANPIIDKSKGKKGSGKSSGKGGQTVLPQTQPAKSIGEEDKPAEGMPGGLPPGLQGMMGGGGGQ
ncbi:MAG: hypothetical protein M0025_13410 [Elusimicrobia bacterium]|nr:hypothetical protein [Elusimicrobiota bacterium]